MRRRKHLLYAFLKRATHRHQLHVVCSCTNKFIHIG
jgi:hypothetical protein